ncbi:DUF4344 domain-containing metallopeptidase [Conexibacter stalactiti]|uniref:DUF4344 domain-containing metallopeptidase n=1 Tax=Conexibacter stalactiti TaxID=1940611 RepID=A0ABU4HXP9_9ACTN|nr:DUF4344 domain-containing metallopeptidase [Conexibacter stalactiti]MDW5598088.1 DUF4344 domain-containing metallopeptidase [Conexibacter stalactiti]MEC5038730.1 DUF4344 domain-containing metallopeptidase [Conexibacter stalactiti]
MTVEWERVSRDARRYARALRRSRAVERVAAAVNDRYVLPNEIPIVFSSELEIGPAYLPDVRIGGRRISFIHFPGSFLVTEVATLRPLLRGVGFLRPIRAMTYANEFVIAHELGHALVDQLDIPITGKEEDAVDGFAAYLLANTSGFGPRSALSAAILFAGFAGDDAPTDDAYADEHSLSQQRVYQFLCWIYGSAPRAFRGIVGRDGLPRARAVRCPSEWRQVNRSWSRLLVPYLKPGADPGDVPAVERPWAQGFTGVDSSVPGLDYRSFRSTLTARGTGYSIALRSAEIDVWELLAARYPQPVRLDDHARGSGHPLMGVNALSATLREIGWPGRLVIDMTRGSAQLVPQP